MRGPPTEGSAAVESALGWPAVLGGAAPGFSRAHEALRAPWPAARRGSDGRTGGGWCGAGAARRRARQGAARPPFQAGAVGAAVIGFSEEGAAAGGAAGLRFALDLRARRQSGGTLPGQVRDVFRLQNRRNDRRFRAAPRRFPCCAPACHDGVALLRIQRAELIFHVEAVLTTQIEQFLALHVQFVRQMINANLLVLQAEIPVLTRRRARQSGFLLYVLSILTAIALARKENLLGALCTPLARQAVQSRFTAYSSAGRFLRASGSSPKIWAALSGRLLPPPAPSHPARTAVRPSV